MRPRFAALADWLRWQETQHPVTIDLTLERIRSVYLALGSPHPAPVLITVAGTNGKGSSIAMLDSILRKAGYRTGVYTSPHLLRYNERFRIDGREIDDAAIVDAFAKIDAARGDISLTYFEFGTLAAFEIFARVSLDVAILEVGMGGRLDATNIIDADLALISTVGLDHQMWLGHDRETIAREKAGILRAGRPVVYGEAEPPRAIIEIAQDLQASLFYPANAYHYSMEMAGWSWSFDDIRYENLPAPALPGAQQYQNAAAVLMVLQLLKSRLPISLDAIQGGLLTVSLPGRYQRISMQPEIWLDVAHNEQSFRALGDFLRQQTPGEIHAVLGVLDDKAIEIMLPHIAEQIDNWHLAAPTSPRAMSVSRLQQAVQTCSGKPIFVYSDVNRAFAGAKAAAGQAGRVIVTGSFFTVAEVMAEQGIDGL
jgi:dihydrofolate synthase/folylpolyglutamate synthase